MKLHAGNQSSDRLKRRWLQCRSTGARDTRARAFTLTELLIVIGIIVLFVTLALPAFNLISGSKSVAGAENEISALLGRAHVEALGIQDYRGVAIYRDAATDRYCGAIVQPIVYSVYPTSTPTALYPKYSYVTYGGHNWVALADVPANATSGTSPPPNSPGNAPSTSPPSPYTAWWAQCDANPSALTMDVSSASDIQTFPAGVGIQVINNCTMNGTSRSSNGYLPVGVILFNGLGVMSSQARLSISIAVNGQLGTIGTFTAYSPGGSQGSIPNYVPGATPLGLPLYPSFGLVAFDKQTFEGQNYYSGLPSQLTSSSTTGTNTTYTTTQEPAADSWLDTNATPLLINRYNGTIVRSE